jgi:hypothetical protein
METSAISWRRKKFIEGGLYWSVSLFKNKETVEAKYNLSIIDNGGSVCAERWSDIFQTFETNKSWGHWLIKKRSDILDSAHEILRDGALCIDVTIQVKPNTGDMYQPPSPHSANMLKLLESSEDADVSFTVGTQTFIAHNNIIKASSPILANYCSRIAGRGRKAKAATGKSIDDISPEAFQLILDTFIQGTIQQTNMQSSTAKN